LENQLALTKARAFRSVQTLLTYIGSFFYKKTTPKGELKWSGHGINIYLKYLKKAKKGGADEIEVTQIKQFCHLMSKISKDPDNDPTGKHILIRHSGT
jgi:hypothetical protein